MKNCTQCGKCCINYSDGGLVASTEDLVHWEDNRPDIFRFVRDGKIWMNPDTGARLSYCPWLRLVPGQSKYTCDIYADRPEDCRHYPVTIDQMVKDGCEMLEPRDLVRPKQAQKTLDRLMADSRPPLS